MNRNERIKRVIASIDLIIADLSRKDSSGFFEHKNALRLLVFKNGFELEDIFREYLPPDVLGKFETYLRMFASNPSLSGDEYTKIVNGLSIIKQNIKDYCQYKNLRIFYSWQSDLPNNTNRGFIQAAVQDAIEEINTEKNLQLVLDQDTRGECGSPDIVNTILRKIDNSDVFIADVSSIIETEDKCVPNSNVMFEMGYAYKSLSDKFIIMIFNEGSGDITKLPFDLGLKRQMTYSCKTDDVDKSSHRKDLQRKVKTALISILESL